jgi:hypothetical protein
VNAGATALGASARARRDPNVFVVVVACAAGAALLASLPSLPGTLGHDPQALAAFAALSVVFQLVTVDVYGRGVVTFGGVGLLATGLTFGVSAAVVTAGLVGAATLVARRRPLTRGVFDVGQLMLAAAAGTLAGELLPLPAAAQAVLAGCAYATVEIGLLVAATALAERSAPAVVWRERLRSLAPYSAAAGPLAYAVMQAYAEMGTKGLAVVAAAPAVMTVAARRFGALTRAGEADVRRASEELEVANEELTARTDDLQALLRFAGGLSARTRDRRELIAYANDALTALAGGSVRVVDPDAGSGTELRASGRPVARLEVAPDVDQVRWHRLREAIAPQLAAALESADLLDRIHRKHLATIAALSKSMEAKDFYTGGHTERVAGVAVELAGRLGFVGPELDAIEVGALLHDIGKIGIPEGILQKPGPLDDEEWKIMKEHPVISEYILSEVDLHPIVLQVARSSHERIDGAGYPDGKAGDEIPLPARIVLVADAFDALTSDRPYRLGRTVPEAIEELRGHAGTQFCPIVVAAMERLYAENPEVLGAVSTDVLAAS